eukprot:767916-Hanusia_phi.AAC.3
MSFPCPAVASNIRRGELCSLTGQSVSLPPLPPSSPQFFTPMPFAHRTCTRLTISSPAWKDMHKFPLALSQMYLQQRQARPAAMPCLHSAVITPASNILLLGAEENHVVKLQAVDVMQVEREEGRKMFSYPSHAEMPLIAHGKLPSSRPRPRLTLVRSVPFRLLVMLRKCEAVSFKVFAFCCSMRGVCPRRYRRTLLLLLLLSAARWGMEGAVDEVRGVEAKLPVHVDREVAARAVVVGQHNRPALRDSMKSLRQEPQRGVVRAAERVLFGSPLRLQRRDARSTGFLDLVRVELGELILVERMEEVDTISVEGGEERSAPVVVPHTRHHLASEVLSSLTPEMLRAPAVHSLYLARLRAPWQALDAQHPPVERPDDALVPSGRDELRTTGVDIHRQHLR